METPDPHVAGWILESLGSGILAIDRHGAVMALNAGAQRILGGPVGNPAAALGRDCREALAAQPAVANLLTDALGRGSRLSRAEVQLAAGPSQPAITIGFTLFPVRGPDGDVRSAGEYLYGTKEGDWIETGETGDRQAVSYRGGKKYGVERVTRPDGVTMKSEITWYADEKEGLARTWHANGQLESQGTYVKNKPAGLWKY